MGSIPTSASMGTSFNGRMAGLHPADESSILSVSTKFACVAEMDKRRSEKPDTEIRALPQAPDVTVAEWLRRWIVAPITRVQFSPVTPFLK